MNIPFYQRSLFVTKHVHTTVISSLGILMRYTKPVIEFLQIRIWHITIN